MRNWEGGKENYTTIKLTRTARQGVEPWMPPLPRPMVMRMMPRRVLNWPVFGEGVCDVVRPALAFDFFRLEFWWLVIRMAAVAMTTFYQILPIVRA